MNNCPGFHIENIFQPSVSFTKKGLRNAGLDLFFKFN
jgi:hypothetical protein